MDHCVPGQTLNLNPLRVWVDKVKVVVMVVGGDGAGVTGSRGIMNRNHTIPHSFLPSVLLDVHHPDWTITRRTAPSGGS